MDLVSQSRYTQLIAEAKTAAQDALGQGQGSRPNERTADGSWTDAVLGRAASLTLAQGSKAAADLLLGEPRVPPSREVAEEMAALFRTNAPSEEEKTRRNELLTRIRELPRKVLKKVKPRDAARQADLARPAAGPGPSGMRNSYIGAIRRLPTGPETLAKWANMWGSGKIHPALARVWTDYILRPGFKPSADAEPSRPIACGEALTKFALGCIFIGVRAQFQSVLGDEQYGNGRAAGAPALVRDIRAVARLRPDRAIVQLDYKNAYGTVEWNDALESIVRHARGVAPCMAAYWGDPEHGQRLFTQTGPGEWRVTVIFGSLIREDRMAPPIFCLIVCMVLMDVRGLRLTSDMWAFIFIDDLTLSVEIPMVIPIVEAIERASALKNLKLVRSKCAIHVPAWREMGPPSDNGLEAALGIPVKQEGLDLMGTVCNGEYATPLYPANRLAEDHPASKRLQRAEKLSKAVTEMNNRPQRTAMSQAAWLLFGRRVSHALDYDGRVCLQPTLAPLAASLDLCVENTAVALMSAQADLADQNSVDEFLNRLRLPLRRGGFQLPRAEETLPAAGLAQYLEDRPRARRRLLSLGMEEEHGLAGMDIALGESDAIICRQILKDRGVVIGRFGLPGTEAPNALKTNAPARHLMSAYLEVLSERREASLRATLQGRPRALAQFLSCGGPSAGIHLIDSPQGEEMNFDDAAWRINLRWRMGLPLCEPKPCGHRRKRQGEACCQQLDCWGDHAVACQIGPWEIGRHDGLADMLTGFAGSASCVTQREVSVEEFSTPQKAAVLDLEVCQSYWTGPRLVDVTVRHPCARYNLARASRTAGASAKAAEKSKQDRYPPRGGRIVTAFAVETFGRIGAEAEALLQDWAAAAARNNIRRGRPPGRHLRRWRAKVSALIAQAVARAVEGALQPVEEVSLDADVNAVRGRDLVAHLVSPTPPPVFDTVGVYPPAVCAEGDPTPAHDAQGHAPVPALSAGGEQGSVLGANPSETRGEPQP